MLLDVNMLNEFNIGDVYYRAQVRDFEGCLIDQDFPRFTTLKESLKQAIKSTDDDYDDFSDCFIFINEYKVFKSDKTDTGIKKLPVRKWILYYGELLPFAIKSDPEDIKSKWIFVDKNWKPLEDDTKALKL